MDVPKAVNVAERLDRAALSTDGADAQPAIEATYRRSDLAGVCVAEGFGVKVTVSRGALVVHDGIGPDRFRVGTHPSRVIAQFTAEEPGHSVSAHTRTGLSVTKGRPTNPAVVLQPAPGSR